MGIYGGGAGEGVGETADKIKKPLIVVVVVIVLALVVVAVMGLGLIKGRTLDIRLEKQSITADEQTTLVATITNAGEEDASDVVLSVEPVDKKALLISPTTITFPTIGKGESRQARFAVNPIRDYVFTGQYNIKVTVWIGGLAYQEIIAIHIEK